MTNQQQLVEQNRENGWQDLPTVHRAFALRYVEDYDHRAAAQEVGIPQDQALRVLRNPLVTAFVNDLQGEMQMQSVINADFVRMQWLKVMPKLMGEEPVPMVAGDGTPIVAPVFQSGAVVRMLTELGKSTKFYANGSNQEGGGSTINNNNVRININEMPPELKREILRYSGRIIDSGNMDYEESEGTVVEEDD